MKPCNEVLFDEGEPVSVCTVEYGTEHSHSDYTAAQSVERGIARPFTETDAYEVSPRGDITLI